MKNNINITYIDNWIPYNETLEFVKKSSCLSELKNEEIQYACSLRVNEAVILYKKILTDNKNVFQMPCCEDKEQFIQFFENTEDIDIGFLKQDTPVDYGYNGEYSAGRFLERIHNAVHNTAEKRLESENSIE